jgi:glycosyltransferase involved in cell wall biosynthesis
MGPRFSLVIPAHNEERLLGRLLHTIAVARASYGPPGTVEVIVADNASTDSTSRIADAHGCRVVPVEKRVIGAVRNAGAKAARGEILAFVDADSQVHPRTFFEIDRALATGRVVGGATGVSMERWSVGIAVVYLALLPFVVVTRLDTGVVFCRRQDFETIGRYDESRLVGEDVLFLLAMRRLGKTRGQRLARVTSAKAVFSTRKFDEFGDWHYFPLLIEGARYLAGRAPTEFIDRYWYKPKR